MKLIIEDDEGRKTVVPVVRDEITIGRQDGNTIKLTERNVSRRHARLWKDNGALLIEDLGSYNGVRVNGDRIAGPTTVKEGDLIEIGDYDLGIQGKLDTQPPAPAPAASPRSGPQTLPPKPSSAASLPKVTPQNVAPAAPMATAPSQAPAPSGESGQTPSPFAGGATAIINVNKLMGQTAAPVELRDLVKNEMPRLVGLAGAFRAKEFYLMRTEWKVGRTEENDLQIDHQSISRQHCKFVLEKEGWKVYDNKSANGVKVNGEEYAASLVKPGDTLELGHVKFRFCAPGEKFVPPPEKVDAPVSSGGKPAPTTAELIAGAQGRGPQAMGKAPPAKSKVPLIAGIGGAVVLVIILAVVLGNRGPKETDDSGNPIGEAAFRQARQAEQKHDYRKALELAESAGDKAPDSYKKKLSVEASGQDLWDKLDNALAKGDVESAKVALDKCATETTHWCGKVKEKEEAVKTAYVKKHLDAATAAKATNQALCSDEVGKVLAVDPGNAEAQGLCKPAAPVHEAPPQPVSNGPSPKEREAMGTKLLTAGIAKAGSADYAGAADDFRSCIDKKPPKEILGRCYKNLGVVLAKQGNNAGAADALKKYLPYCTEACDKIKDAIAKWGG
jgi:pSer/pThr/pTyr-binding forkhead associated (FHA) protein